ncbi:MAG: 30S ribosomal protein S21 [Candidatus Cloacimonetes bacterium]|nr:30S ribosomal protein S21 [Candidatus Cloacimonadota bacterium]MBL7086235.1 30S ribosomal protein S21 [Candidatus Cloacimonadota bacterium]
MTKVIVGKDESFDNAFRRFNRKVQRSGVLSDIKKNRYYEKPSDKKRRELKMALRKSRRRSHYYR